MKSVFTKCFIGLLMLLSDPGVSSGQDCCGEFLKDGRTALKNLNWSKALTEYNKGKGCPDANRCPELAKLYTDILALKKEDEQESNTWNNLQNSQDADKIKQYYIDACKICRYKTNALQRIEQLQKSDQETQNQVYDATLWKKAVNAVTHLPIQEYIDHCKICTHKAEAEQKLKEIQKKEINAQETNDYLHWNGVKLSDDLFVIAAYINDCKTPCMYKVNAEMLLREIIDVRSKPAMVLVSGGEYKMGDLFKDNKDKEEEKIHEVVVGNYYIASKEITFQQYIAFCFDTHRSVPDDHQWGKGNQPVINIDWFDAVEYCNWRSEKDGLEKVYNIDTLKEDLYNRASGSNKKWTVTPNWNANGYRLPTEAEWEYAARSGGKKIRFGNSNNEADPSRINFDPDKKNALEFSMPGIARKRPVPVGSLGSPNTIGLHDMSGNVFEWCWDWFDPMYYDDSIKNSPKGPKGGTTRVVRGGCYFSFPMQCRTSFRFNWRPSSKFHYVGFRVVRNAN